MILVIRNWETGFYFAQGRWIPDPRLAEQFKAREEIQKVVNEHKWQSVEMAILGKSGRARVRGVRLRPME
jgi:hypothetical protein